MRTRISVTSEIFWLGKNRIPYNFAFMARVRGPFSLDDLRAALATAALRHPLVSLRIEVDGAGQGWLESDGVGEIPVRVMENCAEGDWQCEVRAELAITFDVARGPLARVVLLRGADFCDLVVIFNHYICDGMSGVYFTRDLLHLLGEPERPLAPLPAPSSDIMALVPPAAQAAPSMRVQLWAIKTFIPYARLAQRAWDLARRAPPAPERRFCLLAWTLSRAQTDALVARCHAEKTTVHTAICAAWLRADAEIEGERGGKRWLRRVSSPINLRGRLTEPVDAAFGMFMSTMTTPVDCSAGRDFWAIARELRQRMRRELADEQVFQWLLRTNAAIHGLSRAQRREIIDVLSSQAPGYDLAITNLGRLDFPTRYGRLHVEALYGPLVNGFPLERTVSVLTFDGAMHFAFLFRNGVLDMPTAERIKARAMQILAQAAGI